MKRIAGVLVLSAALLPSLATAALAGYPPTKPPAGGVPPAAGQGGVAVTGTNILLGMLVLAALIVVGAGLVLAARRRSIRTS